MHTRNLVGGRWIDSRDGETLPVVDPATDELIAAVPSVGAEETTAAIEAAHEAFHPWCSRPAQARRQLLTKLADLMTTRESELATLITREQGKPLAEARAEVTYAASFVSWAADEAVRLYGDIIPASTPDKRILVMRQPLGVVAAITPWNFPAAMITRKLGPALAAGNTIVIKPAEQTPLTALALAAMCEEVGFPAGVVNVVTGRPLPIADAIFASPRVKKITFTGSTPVGKLLARRASDRLIRLSLELGGHAPFIVFDDADVDASIRGLHVAKFRNGGQTCLAANRVYVQDGIYDRFTHALIQHLERLTVGRGTKPDVDIGPLVDDAAIAKIERHVADARDKGATIRLGGHRARPTAGLSDRFYAPTLIEGFTPDMLCATEETFGPVIPLRRFTTEAEVLAAANASDYGLSAYFYTRDAARLMRVAEALDYGIVGANDGGPSTAQAPFGGWKQSGLGTEGGRYVMDWYTELKYVSWGLR